jgi:hypothetical protein
MAGGAGRWKDVMGSTRCFSLARIARNVQDVPLTSAGMTWDDADGWHAAAVVLRPAMSCADRRKQRKAHAVPGL